MYWPWIMGRIYSVEEDEDEEDKADDDEDDEIVWLGIVVNVRLITM